MAKSFHLLIFECYPSKIIFVHKITHTLDQTEPISNQTDEGTKLCEPFVKGVDTPTFSLSPRNRSQAITLQGENFQYASTESHQFLSVAENCTG